MGNATLWLGSPLLPAEGHPGYADTSHFHCVHAHSHVRFDRTNGCTGSIDSSIPVRRYKHGGSMR